MSASSGPGLVESTNDVLWPSQLYVNLALFPWLPFSSAWTAMTEKLPEKPWNERTNEARRASEGRVWALSERASVVINTHRVVRENGR